MATSRITVAVLAAALTLAGCEGESEPPLAPDDAYSDAEIAGSLPPSPATIAMRSSGV